MLTLFAGMITLSIGVSEYSLKILYNSFKSCLKK